MSYSVVKKDGTVIGQGLSMLDAQSIYTLQEKIDDIVGYDSGHRVLEEITLGHESIMTKKDVEKVVSETLKEIFSKAGKI